MSLPHGRIEFVSQTEVKRELRRRAPVILPIKSISIVIEMASLNSTGNRPELEGGLILEETNEAAAKIHPSAIKNRLSNHEIDVVDQYAEFQRVFAPRIKQIVAQT